MFQAGNNEFVKVGSKDNGTIKNLSKFKKSENNKFEILTYIPNIEATRKPIFLTLGNKKALNYLKQVFIEVSILEHFDLESYIQIEINI